MLRLCACALFVAATAGSASAQIVFDPNQPLQRLALGSCARQDRPQPFWAVIENMAPDAFLFLGDNVYGDNRRDENNERLAGPEYLKEAYDQLAAHPEFMPFRQSIPILATWDDHDYGLNDAGRELPFKDNAKQQFLDFFELPDEAQIEDHEGIYYAVTAGIEGQRVQMIFLDTRYNRSPLVRSDDPNWGPGPYVPLSDEEQTLLGEAQWAWLEEQLQAPADVRLIISSIQIIADSHYWERWGLMPSERERLYALIADTKANGVVFLSGDRHRGGLYRNTEAGPYPFYELTASSLNAPGRGLSEIGPYQLGGTYPGENFGTVDFDWKTRTVSLSLKDDAGEIVQSIRIPLEHIGS